MVRLSPITTGTSIIKKIPVFFYIFSLSVFANQSSIRKVLLLCYPVDPLTHRICSEIERKLAACESKKIVVVKKENLKPVDLNESLKAEMLPANTPVFIVGHGLADLEHRHFLALEKFWDKGPHAVKITAIPRLVEEGKLISAKQLQEGIQKTVKEPAIWYSSCRSGGNCTEGGNIGASCSSWEDTSISNIKGSILKLSLNSDPATRKILNLLCDEKEFESFDVNKDGFIRKEEWNQVFISDHKKEATVSISPDGKKLDPAIKKRVLDQLSTESIFCEKDGLLNLTQKNCVNSGMFNQKGCIFSPVLNSFSLPKGETHSEIIQNKRTEQHK